MKALIQRVRSASVSIDGKIVGSISEGLVVLIGIARNDGEDEVKWVVDKTLNLRLFSDEEGKFQYSASDVSGELLVISQFTLIANTRKGRRPSFIDAARPEHADPLFKSTLDQFRLSGLKVETGRFQAYMNVALDNDGPVTVMIDSEDMKSTR